MRRRSAIVAILLALLVFGLYARTAQFGYVFDDDHYLQKNRGLALGLSWAGVRWAFTSFYHANWQPVAWLAHLTDRALFGPAPGPAHLVNAALHAIACALFFLVLRRLTDAFWPSVLAAALFAFHPLRVESVAWVTERKDPLSTIFWLLAVAAYLRYVRRPAAARYAPVAILFALGLLTKPMVVTFPFALLLLDFWPLGRLRLPGHAASPATASPAALLLEKLPLFALAAAASAVTFFAQSGSGAVRSWWRLTFVVRLGNAVVSGVDYLWQTLWPQGLAVFYPHPVNTLPFWKIAGAALLLGACTAGALLAARRRPWLAVGWLWYLGTLVPMIGLVQVGMQARADRYTYLPSLGLLPAVAWEAARAARRWRRGPALLAATGVLACLALALLSLRQIGFWRDQRRLFTHALDVTENNFLAHYNLGVIAGTEGKVEEAIAHYRATLAISPTHADARVNLGLLLLLQKRTAEAEPHLLEGLRLDPLSAEAHVNYGMLLAGRGAFAAAVEHYRVAIQLRPDMLAAHMNLGNALDDLGRPEEAIQEYREALRLDSRNAEVHYNWGLAWEHLGRLNDAAAEYAAAVRLDPKHAQARERIAKLQRWR